MAQSLAKDGSGGDFLAAWHAAGGLQTWLARGSLKASKIQLEWLESQLVSLVSEARRAPVALKRGLSGGSDLGRGAQRLARGCPEVPGCQDPGVGAAGGSLAAGDPQRLELRRGTGRVGGGRQGRNRPKSTFFLFSSMVFHCFFTFFHGFSWCGAPFSASESRGRGQVLCFSGPQGSESLAWPCKSELQRVACKYSKRQKALRGRLDLRLL